MTGSGQFKTYLDIAYRRKWWILVPTVLSAIAGYFVLDYLPKTYRASTTILVTPQRLPEDFVRSTVTTRVEDRMSSMSVQILSRSFLEKVVREVGLVAEGASEPEIEHACNALRRTVELSAGPNLSYFTVAVENERPERASGIANRLVELFVDQNSQMRSDQATGTLSTVEGWLEKKKLELDETEGRIADYKRGHLWELSEQLNANLQLLQTNQQRLASLGKDIQDRQDKLADARQRAKLDPGNTAIVPEAVDPNARKLEMLEAELAQLRVNYTEENPAVRRKTYEIAEFRKLHPELGHPTVGTPAGAPVATVAPGPRSLLDRLEREIANLEVDRDAVQSQINTLSVRINNTPLREQELKILTRGYEALSKEYGDLLQKREMASRTEELETSRKSEQFKIQDRARTPTSPYKPIPLQVFLICIAAGFGLGAAISILLEFLDQSLKTEDDFRRAFPDLPLLSAVPHVGREATATRGARRPPASRGKHAALVVLLVGFLGASPWVEIVAHWTRA